MIKRLIVLSLLLLALLPHDTMAQDRVIYEVSFITDHKADIHLKWKEENTEAIMINGWNLIDKDVLQINYQVGNVPKGWDKKTIELNHAVFPVKIVLKHTSQNGLLDLPEDTMSKYHILNLYDRGIINGYSDETFRPNHTVTRAEFATMVVNAAQYTLKNLDSTFTDVTDTFWAKPYIMTLADKKILVGKGLQKFDPDGSITIGEVLTVINRTFTLYDSNSSFKDPDIQHWSKEAFKALAESGIVRSDDSYYSPYQPDLKATREQCAVLLSRVLQSLHTTR